MKKIYFVLFLTCNLLVAGELTDLLNGKFRIHNHKIRSISVKCNSSLAGKYRIISQMGQLYEFYTSGITCLDEEFERERYERDWVRPYYYTPYPLVYNFDFEPTGIKNKHIMSKIQLYPRKPELWYQAPKVPFKNEDGEILHSLIYELLEADEFAETCNYVTGQDMTLEECLAYIDEQLKNYPSTAINKSKE